MSPTDHDVPRGPASRRLDEHHRADLETTAERFSDGPVMHALARAGLAARAAVYLLMGVVALLLASGRGAHVDQKGALAQVLAQPFGGLVVGAITVGLAAYALWRLSEAAFGLAGEDEGVWPRLQSLVRGLVYAALGVTAASLLLGSRTPQSTQQRGIVAQLLDVPLGRWLVGATGLVIIGVGVLQVVDGVRLSFLRRFEDVPSTPELRRTITQLGRVGHVARGVAFGITGALVVLAAWSSAPAKAGGLDVALRTLRDQPHGGWLLGAVASGLVAFGVYGFAEARYRRV